MDLWFLLFVARCPIGHDPSRSIIVLQPRSKRYGFSELQSLKCIGLFHLEHLLIMGGTGGGAGGGTGGGTGGGLWLVKALNNLLHLLEGCIRFEPLEPPPAGLVAAYEPGDLFSEPVAEFVEGLQLVLVGVGQQHLFLVGAQRSGVQAERVHHRVSGAAHCERTPRLRFGEAVAAHQQLAFMLPAALEPTEAEVAPAARRLGGLQL